MNNLGPIFLSLRRRYEEAKKAICFRAKCGTISIIRTELTCFSLTELRHDDDIFTTQMPGVGPNVKSYQGAGMGLSPQRFPVFRVYQLNIPDDVLFFTRFGKFQSRGLIVLNFNPFKFV